MWSPTHFVEGTVVIGKVSDAGETSPVGVPPYW